MKPKKEGQSKISVVELNSYLNRVSLPLSLAQIRQVSPDALAYLGDAVYELYIRTHYLLPPRRLQAYHRKVVADVRAETQARHLRSLQPHLTSAELEILRQGRNSASGGPRRIDPVVYQQATSLEVLIGYLYLTNAQRLDQLFQQLELNKTELE